MSLHERLHHELQTTSPWGLVVIAALVSGADATARHAAFASRDVHECFATLFSVGVDEDDLALISDNLPYRDFYHRAAKLAPPDAPWPVRSRVIDALLRASMAPPIDTALTPDRLVDLRAADLRDEWSPDRRLRRVERVIGSESWPEALGEVPADLEMTTTVTFRDHVATLLAERGILTMPFDRQAEWTEAVVSKLNAELVDGRRFETVRSLEDRARADLDDFQHERLQIHEEALPLEIVRPTDLKLRARDFARSHEVIGVHSLLVWLRGDLLARQFQLPESSDMSSDGLVLGLLSCDRTHGKPRALLCPFEAVAPTELFDLLQSRSRILFLTTLATIVDTPHDVRFDRIAPVHALIDQPIIGFVEHTLALGATLRWEPVWIDGDRELSVFVFENSQLPGVALLHITSSAGRHTLARWLRRLADRGVDHAPEIVEGVAGPGLHAIIEHVVGTFWILDQLGGRRHA